ncbi:MAG: 30S ribosomal protein S17 [Parcubacteria group bacterium]|nr:30S ribosomal protein S17 [Parcubacteria group bacterium]
MKNETHNTKKDIHHRQFTGVVVSDRMQKTRVVEIRTLKAHPKYHKRYWTRKRYKAHDEENQTKIGDKVLFRECRPLSKEKRWKIVMVVKN